MYLVMGSPPIRKRDRELRKRKNHGAGGGVAGAAGAPDGAAGAPGASGVFGASGVEGASGAEGAPPQPIPSPESETATFATKYLIM